MANISTGKDGNGTAPSIEAKELLRTTYLRALRDAYSEMQSGKRSRLSQIMQHVSIVGSLIMSALTITFIGVFGLDALSLYKTEKCFSSTAGNISSAKTFA